MTFLRRLLCTMLGHPRGMIFTGAGGWFCPACVRDMSPVVTFLDATRGGGTGNASISFSKGSANNTTKESK